MTGHVRKRGKRSWAIIVELDHGPDGKRCQKWHSVKGTKKEAESRLTEILHSIETGVYVAPAKLTVEAYLEKWLETTKATIAGKTFERYREIAKRHLVPALGRLMLPRLTPLHIQAYYSHELSAGRLGPKIGGLSAQTVLHHHRVLREALQQAVRWQLLARNPADAVEPPKPQRREMNAINATQMAWLLSVVTGTRFHVPILLALTTGMRRGEFLGLRWSDINLNTGTAAVRRSVEQTNEGIRFKSPKGKRGRLISLPDITVEALGEYKQAQRAKLTELGISQGDDELVCALEDGSLWAPDTFTAQFARLAKRAGLKGIRLHDMRHSHATHLLQQGVHPKIVSERLGHSTVAITLDTYSHVLPGMQEDAAMKVDSTLREAIRKQRTKTTA
jgi:integrase